MGKRNHNKQRETFGVAHIAFEIDAANKTFGLVPGDAETALERRPLFTGFIEKGMSAELRRFADRIDEIEAMA